MPFLGDTSELPHHDASLRGDDFLRETAGLNIIEPGGGPFLLFDSPCNWVRQRTSVGIHCRQKRRSPLPCHAEDHSGFFHKQQVVSEFC